MTVTTTEELRLLASSDNTNELTRRLARECLANREAQPVGVMNIGSETCSDYLVAWTKAGAQLGNGVHWLYTAPPAPAVPAEMSLARAIEIAWKDSDIDSPGSAYRDGWNACRAAMLAQPVSSGYKLPDGWIACSEQMPEVGERDWRTALPVLVKCEIGVIPAYYGFTYHEGEQCFGFMESVKFGDASGSGPEQHENRLMMHVTHWMPLPAAPDGKN